MKELLIRFIRKGYKPTFYGLVSVVDDSFPWVPIRMPDIDHEKLELYLMRDFMEEKYQLHIDISYSKKGKYQSKVDAMKVAMLEALKFIDNG